MNHNLKMNLRNLSEKNKFFSNIYHKVSRLKTEKYQGLSDEEFLKRKFKENTGKDLDLENPKTFNEKLQWLKLYDRKPIYTKMADKFAVKEYVSERIGSEHIIPIVGGPWYNANEICWDKLPNQFVLKCNHDCGSVIICKDKTHFDFASAGNKLNRALKSNYFYVGREWPYKNIKPCIFAEKYMDDESGYELKDYKFFCFDGIPKAMFIATERFCNNKGPKFDFFDMEFNHLPFWNDFPNADVIPGKPKFFEEMKDLAGALSKNIPFVRVDFYECNNQIYFGEITFYHAGGTALFHPDKWDNIFGDWIDLPNR